MSISIFKSRLTIPIPIPFPALFHILSCHVLKYLVEMSSASNHLTCDLFSRFCLLTNPHFLLEHHCTLFSLQYLKLFLDCVCIRRGYCVRYEQWPFKVRSTNLISFRLCGSLWVGGNPFKGLAGGTQYVASSWKTLQKEPFDSDPISSAIYKSTEQSLQHHHCGAQGSSCGCRSCWFLCHPAPCQSTSWCPGGSLIVQI